MSEVWAPLLADGLNVGFGKSLVGFEDAQGVGATALLVGAPSQVLAAQKIGRAYLYGAANGLLLHTFDSPNGTHLGGFASAVAPVPDVSGDGADDILIGAPGESGGAARSGFAYVYAKPVSAGSPAPLLLSLTSPQPEVLGNFGFSVCGIHDLNGGGVGDVLVGAPNEDAGAVDSGRVYVLDGANGTVLLTLASPTPQMDGNFGWAVASMPDATGDGLDEIVVGAPGELGRVHVFDGGTGVLLHTITAPPFSGVLGRQVTGVGDLDGDGLGDIIASGGGTGGPNNSGSVFIFSGADGTLIQSLFSPHPISGGRFGVSIATAPDVDGDGLPELLVGALAEPVAGQTNGHVYVFGGGTFTVLSELVSPPPAPGTPQPGLSSSFGWAVAALPDVDGDGLAECAVGSPWENPGGFGSGAAYVFPCSTKIAGAAVPRAGTPPNPLALTTSQVPMTGVGWPLVLDDAQLVSGALVDFLLVGFSAANIPTAKGTVLVGANPLPLLLPFTPVPALLLQIPADCALAGVQISLQGGAYDGTKFRLSNALDLTIGS